MSWSLELIAAIVAVNLVRVASKSFQQLSVVHDSYALVPIGSLLMAGCEVMVWAGAGYFAVNGSAFDLVIYALILGISGAAGSLFAMRLHRAVRES